MKEKTTELIFGRHAETKTKVLLERMRSSLESGREIVIIVPKNQSLYWERTATKNLDKKYANDIEIVSFQRLADSVFRKYGGIAKNYIGDSEKALLMWNAILSERDNLRIYGNKYRESGRENNREDRYVDTFLHAISELKMYGISAEMLFKASEQITDDKNLCDKLHDLYLVYSAYSSLLSDSFFDPEDVSDALCEKLRENNYFENKDVYIDAFHTLTPKELRVAEIILANAENSYITIAQEDKPEDKFAAGDSYIGNYVKTLSAMVVNNIGHSIKKTHCDDPRDEIITKLSRGLFNYAEKPYTEKTDRITVIKCNDRYDEALLALTRIKQLVKSGAKYSEIALVTSSLPNLYGIFDTEAEKEGIPVYTAEKHTLSRQGAFKFIISAVNVLANGWKKENIISLAKSGFCNLTEDESNAFEKYVNVWNINSKYMFTLETWDMNSEGLTDKKTDWEEKCRKAANSAKAEIIPELVKFAEQFRKPTVKDKCIAVFNLLCAFDVFEKLKKEAQDEKAEKRLAQAKETAQIWPAICSALDTVCRISGHQSVDAKKFISLIRKCADNITVGYIPDGIEKVVLGSVDNMRLDSYKHIILLGAAMGEFPKAPTDNDYFTTEDKVRLEGLPDFRTVFVDKLNDRTEEAIFRFKYAASSPEETLTVMVPTVGKRNQPSIGAEEVMRLFENCIPIYDFTGTDGVRVICSRNVDKESGSFPISADKDKISDELAAKVYSEDFKFSQSIFEKFLECRCKFINTYILNLSDDQTATVRENILGTFVHEILEKFMKWAIEERSFPIDRTEVDEMCDKYAEDFISLNCPMELSPRSRRYFDRLKKNTKAFAQSLNKEFAQSKFEPFGFEVEIGKSDGSAPALDIPLSDGRVIRTKGYIDRVDLYRKGDTVYVRVVDYKTGKKSFKLKEALEGHNFQMLYYLFSLTSLPDCTYRRAIAPNGEKIEEAGVLYFETVSDMPKDYSSDNGYDVMVSHVHRTGLILDDIDVRSAMDENMEGEFAPINKASLSTREGFKEDKEILLTTLSEIGTNIVSGYAQSQPGKDDCKYCNFRASCRHTDNAEEDEEGGESNE